MKNFIFLPLALTVLLLAACAPTHAVRGNIVEDHRLEQVQVGIDTQSDVLRKLGSPTTKAPFDDSVWYYMGQKTEKRGILDPKIVEERVMEAAFDLDGVLISLRDITTDRTDVPYVRRKTPTTGHDMTVLQQMLGNMGRFNKPTDGSASATRTGSGGF